MALTHPIAKSLSCDRCSTYPTRTNNDVLKFLDIELNWQAHRVTRNNRPVYLSTLDVRLLRFLMSFPGQVFTRAELLAQVWPPGVFVSERTVDVHIATLRKALGELDPTGPVRTVRGRGYSLDIADC